MDADSKPHPSDQHLRSYGLGRLDDSSATAIRLHLNTCAECRRRVAEVTSDTFLDIVRGVKARPESLPPVRSSLLGVSHLVSKLSPVVPPLVGTLPAGLSEHPDYEILREVGRGGMGVVYLAQNKLMGRKEVLKVVSGHIVGRPGVLDRFLREIRLAARLHHPNIVTAYSALRAGESIVLAMEYVEGYDLAQLVKSQGPLQVGQTCNFVHQAALGLQYANERGMVHRDIKPSNLMLAREGNKPVIKILDFGLSKVTRQGNTETSLTREGQMLGTPDFIAPEQIRQAQSADIRADVYSLGCTMYYLLAGRPPFAGENLWDLYQAHFSMNASPLNLVRPEVPADLAALVAKMMAKSPARRFQEPKEVAEALARYFKKTAGRPWIPVAELTRGGSHVSFIATANDRSPDIAPEARKKAAAPVHVSNNSARGAPQWDTLIQVGVEGPSGSASPAVGPPKRERSPWMWPALPAALLIGVLALGTIYMTSDQHDATIQSLHRKPNPPFRSAERPVLKVSKPPRQIVEHSQPDPPKVEALPQQRPSVDPSPRAETSSGGQSLSQNSRMSAPAAPSTPEQRLNSRGLRREKALYILKREAEVRPKFEEAQSSYDAYVSSRERKMQIELAQRRAAELDQLMPTLRHDIEELGLQLRQMPQRNNFEKQQAAGLRAQQDQYSRQLNDARLELDRIRIGLRDRGPIQELDAEIRSRRQAFESSVRKVRDLIGSTKAAYDELRNDEQVREDLGKLKLGPSREFKRMDDQSSKLERELKVHATAAGGR